DVCSSDLRRLHRCPAGLPDQRNFSARWRSEGCEPGYGRSYWLLIDDLLMSGGAAQAFGPLFTLIIAIMTTPAGSLKTADSYLRIYFRYTLMQLIFYLFSI